MVSVLPRASTSAGVETLRLTASLSMSGTRTSRFGRVLDFARGSHKLLRIMIDPEHDLSLRVGVGRCWSGPMTSLLWRTCLGGAKPQDTQVVQIILCESKLRLQV